MSCAGTAWLCHLQPRVSGLLRYLIEHRDRVVGRQELIDALWGGSQLNAVAVPWTINRVRKALGEAPFGAHALAADARELCSSPVRERSIPHPASKSQRTPRPARGRA